MSTILRPDGTREEVHPQYGKSFTLKELQEIVEGHIELLRTRDDRPLVINETGKLDALPRNEQATALVDFPKPEEVRQMLAEYPEMIFVGSLEESDYIVGTVLLCDDSEVQ